MEERECKTVTTVCWWEWVTFLTDEMEGKGKVILLWLKINRTRV